MQGNICTTSFSYSFASRLYGPGTSIRPIAIRREGKTAFLRQNVGIEAITVAVVAPIQC